MTDQPSTDLRADAREIAPTDGYAEIDRAAAPEWIWRDGDLVPWRDATVHVNTIGASVAAIFEGIRAYRAHDGGRLLVFRLADHLARFEASARLARIQIDHHATALRDAVVELLTANAYRDDVYVRPWAFPRGRIREMLTPADVACEVVIDTWPLASRLGGGGCRAGVSSWRRIGPSSMAPRVKAVANYYNSRLAMVEAQDRGYDYPIMLNERGTVSEGPGACVVIVLDGEIVTPNLTSNVLESITRDTALTLLSEIGIECTEREVDREELYLADEVFLVGTAKEITPIVAVDGLQVADGRAGAVTRRLADAYEQVVRGLVPDLRGWLTVVPVAVDDDAPVAR